MLHHTTSRTITFARSFVRPTAKESAMFDKESIELSKTYSKARWSLDKCLGMILRSAYPFGLRKRKQKTPQRNQRPSQVPSHHEELQKNRMFTDRQSCYIVCKHSILLKALPTSKQVSETFRTGAWWVSTQEQCKIVNGRSPETEAASNQHIFDLLEKTGDMVDAHGSRLASQWNNQNDCKDWMRQIIDR